jgi:hypothetical protein
MTHKDKQDFLKRAYEYSVGTGEILEPFLDGLGSLARRKGTLNPLPNSKLEKV